MARLCTFFAERLQTGGTAADRVLAWTGDRSSRGDAVPLRLAAALHALVLRGACPRLATVYPPFPATDSALEAEIERALGAHPAVILDWLDSSPQTNEVRRSAGLIPAFHELAQRYQLPLATSELGASAGLNANWPAYRLQLPGDSLGDDAAALLLKPRWRGPLPPQKSPDVAARTACDLNPLSPADPASRLRLLSYLWPDQPDRLALMRAALDVAARTGLAVQKADAADWLESRLHHPRKRHLHVVYHTIVWQYFPDHVARRCLDLLQTAGANATPDAPFAWLRIEADTRQDGAPILLTQWPGGDTHTLGRMDFHGRWVTWQGLPAPV